MALNSEIRQPLRFYTSKSKRIFESRLRSDIIQKVILTVPANLLIPFTLRRTTTGHGFLGSVKIYDENEVSQTLSLTITKTTANGYDYLRYFASSAFSSLKKGTYYLYVNDSEGNVWYSDWFNVGSTTNLYKIEYSNSFNYLGKYDYSDSFKNWFYIDCRNYLNDYDEYKETISDFNKIEYSTIIRKNEINEIVTLVNTPMLQCIEMLPIHDTITLYDNLGNSGEIEIVDINKQRFGDYFEAKIRYMISDNELVFDISTMEQVEVLVTDDDVTFVTDDDKEIAT